MKKPTTLIAFGITLIIAGASYMFPNSRSELSKDWLNRFNNTNLFNEYSEQYTISFKDVNITGARIPGSKTKNFSFKNVSFVDFGGKESIWENGEFVDSKFDDFSFHSAHLKNIVFKDSKFNVSYFGKAKLENVKFINCVITNSSFFNLKDSTVEFIDSKIIDNDYKFSKSHAQFRFINTEIINSDFDSLKPGSSIYMEGSTNIESTYQHSKLDFFKVIDSKLINTTASDSEIGQFIMENSFIDFSFGDASVSDVIMKNCEIPNMGAMGIKANNFIVSDCKDDAIISFSEATINNIEISNCNFSELYPAKMTTDSLSIENSTIDTTMFYQSKIKNFTMTNVTFTNKANFKDFTATKTTFDNITKTPNLKLKLDGSNIKL